MIDRHPPLPIAPKGTGGLLCAELTAASLEGQSPAQASRHAGHQVERSVLKTQLAESKELCLATLFKRSPTYNALTM
ncbi:hypothetical protein [Candidatus Symbiopectobacterium sp. NZEC151]|uniref:hypothetical protein n=1 Tax=Candidatus Symbiopectobacterium sp. NZEC151 TaxID=2820470 RepID=UPI002226478D|nr:hypothetical protein [Candidatus Symbiopectobacterium sp. NZEC151]MCW2474541.1 hypothetical protein [Candidatus Symbiopectobacterium sp. NZEC151]